MIKCYYFDNCCFLYFLIGKFFTFIYKVIFFTLESDIPREGIRSYWFLIRKLLTYMKNYFLKLNNYLKLHIQFSLCIFSIFLKLFLYIYISPANSCKVFKTKQKAVRWQRQSMNFTVGERARAVFALSLLSQ